MNPEICKVCGCPKATKLDEKRYKTGQGKHLCWGDGFVCQQRRRGNEREAKLKSMVHCFDSKLVKEAFKLSRSKETKTLAQLIMKCCEEAGELCQAFLSMDGAPANEWREKTIDDVHEEVTDLLLCVISVTARSEMPMKRHEHWMKEKLKRWQEKLDGTYKKPKNPTPKLTCEDCAYYGNASKNCLRVPGRYHPVTDRCPHYLKNE